MRIYLSDAEANQNTWFLSCELFCSVVGTEVDGTVDDDTLINNNYYFISISKLFHIYFSQFTWTDEMKPG